MHWCYCRGVDISVVLLALIYRISALVKCIKGCAILAYPEIHLLRHPVATMKLLTCFFVFGCLSFSTISYVLWAYGQSFFAEVESQIIDLFVKETAF